jgi:hypothetical protein
MLTTKKHHNKTVLDVSKNEPLKIVLAINGKINKTANASNKVITPPSLLGIDLSIA